MKSIAVVLILFGFVATGIGVYFIRQSQVSSTRSKAFEVIKPLPRILDSECDYMYSSSCPLQINGEALESIPRAIEKVMRQHAAPSVLTYSEPVPSAVFTDLGAASDLPVKSSYTVPEIVARVSLSSNINYKLLLTLFATQGAKAWNGQAPLSNPLGRRELSFSDQFIAMTKTLKASYQGKFAIPINFVTNGPTMYQLDPDTMNTASRSLYNYFANNLSEAEFKQFVLPDSIDGRSFKDTWYDLFPEDALRK